jgi:hypothetical protein
MTVIQPLTLSDSLLRLRPSNTAEGSCVTSTQASESDVEDAETSVKKTSPPITGSSLEERGSSFNGRINFGPQLPNVLLRPTFNNIFLL